MDKKFYISDGYKPKSKKVAEDDNKETKEEKESAVSIDLNGDTPIVYIYDEIQHDDGDVFEQCIRAAMIDDEGKPIDIKEIEIDINSPGGSLSASLSIMAQIQELQKQGVIVTGIVKGKAMSGGCIILLACDKRLARKFSTILYHPALIILPEDTYLTVKDLKELQKTLASDWKILKQLLEERTKLTDKEINKIYKDCLDYQLTVDEALEKGFIDNIL